MHTYFNILAAVLWYSVPLTSKQTWSIWPRAASVVELTLASGSWTDLVPAGSASVSLAPWLCTRLPGVWSSARLRHRRPSATAFVDYVSARRSTHRACYRRRPSLPGGCCICLEQSAGDSTLIAVIASFPQYRLKTELFARFYSCSD